jgi:hypothetical protein
MLRKSLKFVSVLVLLLAGYIPALAQSASSLVLGAPVLKEVDGRTIVTLQVQNTMPSAVTGARAWVFLMDAKGKVVGNHSQWLITDEAKNALQAGTTREFTISVTATGATQAKVIFPRIVLADGSTRVIKE